MAKMLAVYPERCTACRMCELACSVIKTGAFNPSVSRIKVSVFHEDHAYMPLACFQCASAPCAKVCPADALNFNSIGVVELNEKTCIGCKMCVIACPFGVMGFDAPVGLPTKCDLCGGDPNCVKFCVPNALELVDTENVQNVRNRMFAQKLVEAEGKEVVV